MATQVWSQEPIVKEADSKADGPGLRDDLGIRGVWTPQVEAFFDTKVIDTDAPSHLHHAGVSRTPAPARINVGLWGSKDEKAVQCER